VRFLAYLDPGSASALLAAVLAGVAGIGAAIRTFGSNFLKTLMFWKKDEEEPSGSTGTESGDAGEGDSDHDETPVTAKTSATPSDGDGSPEK
jgi:hypothetical protein